MKIVNDLTTSLAILALLALAAAFAPRYGAESRFGFGDDLNTSRTRPWFSRSGGER